MNALILFLAATLSGTVKDPSGQPLSNANVSIASIRTVSTDANGSFSVDVADGAYALRISHPGFQPQSLTAKTGESVELTLDPAYAETMVVSAIRAEETTPVTKSDVTREDITREYYGQDVPLLLRDAPSINAYAESGAGGAGYSYISLRGVSPSRINFTLDGVPLADSEDMGTYFADFPDLARSLESVQIQRGVGTSTVGTPSFGGSVNMESVALSQTSRTEATLGLGSFGGEQASVGWQSGALPGGLSLYTRVSYLESDGFRDNSASRQRNIFFSGAKELNGALLKLTGFAGHMNIQSSYYATDEETLKSDLRNNPLRPEEREEFGYNLGQLQYIKPLGDSADMTASVYFQRGYGWYQLFSSENELRRYGLDGRLFGAIVTYSKTSGAMTLNTGVHLNRFQRDHTRDNLVHDRRDYANDGVKGEANAFAKVSYDAGAWHLYGDAQVRHAAFDYHGSADIDSIDWTFFNPKVGARYRLSAASSVYGSAGMTTREPTRNDLFLGADNPPVALDLHGVEPERVLDLELGWSWRAAKLELDANVYAMEFHNEIAATGEQSEIGLALRKNVDRSYRRGIELEAAWQVTPAVRLRTGANVSRNRIREWTQFVDVYDLEGNWNGSTPLTLRNVEPLLTPSVILNQAVDYTPNGRFSAGATGRWVGRSYLDNTNNPQFDTPSFFLLDAKASYAITPWARVSLQVNNLLDAKRVYASGYSYQYYSGEELTGIAYYYPQATRNAAVLMDFSF
ncbi:MAG TPA: TonB-dependent receptor [Thermoanaerobaculia bacterium]|nr:TonB-dependent receptor [Thermoanaerobaculia bacterium]